MEWRPNPAPTSWNTKKKNQGMRFASSEALVYSYTRRVSGKDLDKIEGMSQKTRNRKRMKDEMWFCRRSCHRCAADTGAASWDEFVHSFKEHHHETEERFTPTVIGAREAVTWDTTGVAVFEAFSGSGARWVDISLKVVEMKHKIDPKPLKNRTFPVVQVAALLADTREEFLVVSVPFNYCQKSAHAEYARDKSLAVVAYVAVERIRFLPETGEIEWIMATASRGCCRNGCKIWLCLE
ncbi:unnamed protein product [Calypogeia fissa]